jgi:hypothetical protein
MSSLVVIRERTYVDKMDISLNGELMGDLKSNPRQANMDGEIEFLTDGLPTTLLKKKF